MNTLQLPGLKGTEPIGFLAAAGLLRVLAGRRSFGSVKLGWSDDSAWSAILHTETACDRERLVSELLGHLTGRGDLPVFGGRDPDGRAIGGTEWKDIKVDPELFRTWLIATRSATDRDRREEADFLSAFGSELVTARSSGDLKPSAFHMSSARQQFLEACRKLANSLGPSAVGSRGLKGAPPAFQEALFGPWEYADEFSALGFDPNTEAVYALVASAPGDEKPVSTRAAVWLAIEAMPLFSVVPVKGRLHTRGFDLRATRFRWPIWNGTLTADAVRTAVGLAEVVDQEVSIERLDQLAIRAVMEVERVTIGQGYGQLRPALRVR
jgi:hypothetical protein